MVKQASCLIIAMIPGLLLIFSAGINGQGRQKDTFYILNENQGVYQVAIRRADMAEDDPPVYVVETDEDGTVNEIGQAESSLSAFMMGMLIYEAAISCFEFCAEDIIWYDDGDIEKIDGILNKYPYHVYNWYSDRIDLYTKLMKRSCLLCREILRMVHIQHGTETAYKEIDRLIGGIGER